MFDISDAKKHRVMEYVLEKVREERKSQDQAYPDDIGMEARRWLPILAEEQGEVARAILTDDRENLYHELVQVAAVSVAWLEDLHRRHDIPIDG